MILKINDRIRTRTVEFFNSFTVKLQYDAAASSFVFEAYFNPDNIEHKEMFCIGHYHQCTLEHNGELLLTGNIITPTFKVGSTMELANMGGYSTPGVLQDCNIPPSLYPLQSDNMSLREIATKLIKPFNIVMVVDKTVSKLMDEDYEKTTADATASILDYLTSLANQKNIVITHNAEGHLVFTHANTNRKPLLNFSTVEPSTIPFTDMSLAFNGQGMHSHIHVIKEPDEEGEGNAGESEIRNPYVINTVYRPRVITQSSGTDIDTDKAARMALGAELKNLKLIITTSTWELNGKMIKPNNLITVLNPKVYLYEKSTWFIESVELKSTNKEITATLTCCLPEVYNEAPVKYLFHGINLH